MNDAIRRVGLAMLVLFVALAGQLTYLQVIRADDLESDPDNVRVFLKDLNRPRGSILSADGAVLAESIPSMDDGDDLDLQRVYPPATAGLFAHIVGYQSVNFGNIGVEAEYNGDLVGRRIPTVPSDFADLLAGEDLRGNVVLTASLPAQQLAAEQLGDRKGSVVVLDTATGGVVVAYSNPTYDPNFLASHNVEIASAAFQLINAKDNGEPGKARSWREIYAPGSTFKVVTTGVALDAGIMTPEEPVYPSISELELPLTDNTLENFGGDTCGGNLTESFRRSCNTTFGQIGLDLGERLADDLALYGISEPPLTGDGQLNSGAIQNGNCAVRPPPADVNPGVSCSIGPAPGSFKADAPLFALSAIGQGPVAVTPIEMAMVAQAVANRGEMMVPHVLSHVETVDGQLVPESRYDPSVFQRSMTPETAATLTQLMVNVVNNGTGTRAQIPGIQVAGKTGTAQVEGDTAHAWFIGFAPAEAPRYAIAVLVENGGDLGDEATGGRVAAPIAGAVLQRLLQG